MNFVRSTLCAAILSATALMTPAQAQEPSIDTTLSHILSLPAALSEQDYEAKILGTLRDTINTMGWHKQIDPRTTAAIAQGSVEDEQKRAVAFYLSMDTNGDGYVSRDEIVAAVKKSWPPAYVADRVRTLVAADTNGDGYVDLEEMRAAVWAILP
jgi:membrane-bound ClpP family serine protease